MTTPVGQYQSDRYLVKPVVPPADIYGISLIYSGPAVSIEMCWRATYKLLVRGFIVTRTSLLANVTYFGEVANLRTDPAEKGELVGSSSAHRVDNYKLSGWCGRCHISHNIIPTQNRRTLSSNPGP